MVEASDGTERRNPMPTFEKWAIVCEKRNGLNATNGGHKSACKAE